MDSLRSSLGRHFQRFVRVATFRKYHCEAAGLTVGAWDKLICEVIRAGHLGSHSNSEDNFLLREEFAKALGLKDSAGELEDLDGGAPTGPLDRIARSRAKKRGSIVSQYSKGRSGYLPNFDSSYFSRAGYQWRSSSTLQEASKVSRTSGEVELAVVDVKKQAPEFRVTQSSGFRKVGHQSSSHDPRGLAKQKPPKALGAAGVVWEIHAVLSSTSWGPASEEALGRLGLQLRNHHVSQVLRGLKDPKLAWHFFKWCKKQSGYKHDGLNYNMMVGMLAQARIPKAVLVLLEEMCVEGLEVNSKTLITIILNFDKGDKIQDVLHIFSQTGRYRMQVNVGVYTCLIDVLAKREEYQQVMRFYSLLQQSNWTLDNTAYNVLMRAFGRAKNVGKVYSLFQEMKKKDVPTYNIVIDCLGKTGKPDEACELLREMMERGLKPDVVTYNSLFDSLGKSGQVNSVHKLYKEMLTSRISPNEITCSILVEALGGAGRLQTACDLFLDMMRTPGVKMDVIVYNSMLNKLGKAGRLEQLRRLFEEMKEVRQEPDIYTYNIVINALCEDQEFKIAYEVFVEMKSAGCRPDVVTYNNLIHSLGRAGKVARAKKLFQQMIREGLVPDQISHNIMINVLGKARKIDQALKVLKDMKDRGMRPDVVTYNRLIDTFGKAGDCKAAHLLYTEMLENRIAPDLITFSVLINGLARNHKVDAARKVLRDMRDRGLRPDVVTYNSLICGYIREGRIAEANEMLIRMKASKVEPSATTYAILIDGNARHNNDDMVFKLREERIEAGYAPEWSEVM
ncbi:unnamed protein product [Calypogeia fissa]